MSRCMAFTGTYCNLHVRTERCDETSVKLGAKKRDTYQLVLTAQITTSTSGLTLHLGSARCTASFARCDNNGEGGPQQPRERAIERDMYVTVYCNTQHRSMERRTRREGGREEGAAQRRP